MAEGEGEGGKEVERSGKGEEKGVDEGEQGERSVS